MGNFYQQFLGSKPGILVELIDDSSSPFTVRTDTGFEFFVSAEDFRNYYKEKEGPTPFAMASFGYRCCYGHGGCTQDSPGYGAYSFF